MRKRITLKIIRELVRLKKKGLHIREISSRIGVSDRTVNKYTINFPHPNRTILIPLPQNSDRLSLEKSEILGYLCSEGNNYDKVHLTHEYDPRRNKTYLRKVRTLRIIFSNKEPQIQKRFILLMKRIYSYNLNPSKNGSFFIRRKNVIKDLNKYSNFGSRIWVVPRILFEKKYKKHAMSFVKAFFDGDGTVETKQREVRIDSCNHSSLKLLSKLIKKLKLDNKYYRFNDRSRIVIKNTNLFLTKISTSHPKKLSKLKRIRREREFRSPKT